MESERLYLREFQLSDAENIYRLNTNIEVMRYTGDPPFESVAAAAQFLKNYDAYAATGFGRWAVMLKESDEFIGWCGLKQHKEYVDIGFRFFQEVWGRGYATEAAKACLDYGFQKLQLPSIVGRAAKANVASIRVLEKLGMKYWKADSCKGISDAVYYIAFA